MWRYILDAGMAVKVIVSVDEGIDPRSRFCQTGKSTVWVSWTVLNSLENCLYVGIIVAHPWPGVSIHYPKAIAEPQQVDPLHR